MIRLLLCVTGLVWVWGSLQGQSVMIQGFGSGYHHRSLELYLPGNPFLSATRPDQVIPCDSAGYFSMTASLEQPQMLTLRSGIHEGWLYAMPGYQYEVRLPDFVEKAYSDALSPFYQPVRVPLEVISRSRMSDQQRVPGRADLNYQLARYDTLFYGANELVMNNRRRGKATRVDSIIQALEYEFREDTAAFFQEYRKYRAGMLKLNEGRAGLESIGTAYLGPPHSSEPSGIHGAVPGHV